MTWKSLVWQHWGWETWRDGSGYVICLQYKFERTRVIWFSISISSEKHFLVRSENDQFRVTVCYYPILLSWAQCDENFCLTLAGLRRQCFVKDRFLSRLRHFQKNLERSDGRVIVRMFGKERSLSYITQNWFQKSFARSKWH